MDCCMDAQMDGCVCVCIIYMYIWKYVYIDTRTHLIAQTPSLRLPWLRNVELNFSKSGSPAPERRSENEGDRAPVA